LSGGSVVLGRKPTGAAVAAAVTREKVTTIWGGSPQFLGDLAREVGAHPDTYDLSGVEVIIYGWIMVDRYKDVIKSGGENVSSIRVESVLAQHPSVDRAAVVGVPDDRWGEAVTAVVVPAAGTIVDEQDVIAFCRARLAGYETPKRVLTVSELPTTVGGKVLKYRLRRQVSDGR
jgi:acyl-CoA synthetase (AMP-forming)/AMP-acid ligase II